MAAVTFRVTQIDLDENEDVSAVHAVADEATLAVIRQLTASDMNIRVWGGGTFGAIRASAWDGGVLFAIRMPAAAFLEVLDRSGKIRGDDPLYRAGLNDSLFRIWAGLTEGRL